MIRKMTTTGSRLSRRRVTALTACAVALLPLFAACSVDRPSTPAAPMPTVATTKVGVWPSLGFGGVFAVTSSYVIHPDPADPRTTVVAKRGDDSVILRHRVNDRRFETDFAGLYRDWAVLVDEDAESGQAGKAGAQGWIYDLRTGGSTAVSKIPGAPPLSMFGPQATITSDGKYDYSASVGSGSSNCVGEIDLTRMQGRTVECAKEGEMILYVNTGDRGATWTYFKGGGFDACRVGRGVQDGQLFTIAADECDTFDTAAVGGWSVRSVQSPSQPIQPAMPLTATHEGATVKLGDMRGQSLIGCGGYAYWKRDVAGDAPAQEIMRWRPDGEVELVYRQAETPSNSADSVLLTPRSCNEGILAFTSILSSGDSFDGTLMSAG